MDILHLLSDTNGQPFGFIVIAFFTVLAFLGFREVLAWYWKINKAIELLERIEENTRPKENSTIADEPEKKEVGQL
jgi:hypothetical protein